MEGVFLGSEALESGALTRHELRMVYRRVLPDVYAPKRTELTLAQKATAAWLWSCREGVISGVAASALLGAEWVDDDAVIELNWPNHRSPAGILTRNDTLLDGEVAVVVGLPVTTPERTAFDLARRGSVSGAVARLDALARATHFKAQDVEELAQQHPHVKGLRRVDRVLDLVDAGAESPKESWLRTLLISGGYRRPETQIPVLRADGYSRYYLDMGWEDIKVAVEYDGEHHRADPRAYRKDIERLDYLASVGWIIVRVVQGDRKYDILARVDRAIAARGGL